MVNNLKQAICPICGQVFVKFGKQKYCSDPCREMGKKRAAAARLARKTASHQERVEAHDIKIRALIDQRINARAIASDRAESEGSALALMNKARRDGDRLAYWRAFKEYLMTQPWGYRYRVNDVPITSSSFEADVLDAIAKTNAVIISMSSDDAL